MEGSSHLLGWCSSMKLMQNSVVLSLQKENKAYLRAPRVQNEHGSGSGEQTAMSPEPAGPMGGC